MHHYELTGQRFGKLTALSYNGSGKWLCICDCGNTTIVDTYSLRKLYKSCGCFSPSKYLDRTLPAKNFMFRNYKKSAEFRKHSFSLNFDEFINISQQNCFYCGQNPIQICKMKSSIFIYNGIDRVDNHKGYELNNIVPCCKKCNRAKWKRNKEEFISWVNKCHDHLILNNL